MNIIRLGTLVCKALDDPRTSVLVVLPPGGGSVRWAFDILLAAVGVRHSIASRGADELVVKGALHPGPSLRVVRVNDAPRIVGLRVDVIFVEESVKRAAGEAWASVGSRLTQRGRVEYV